MKTIESKFIIIGILTLVMIGSGIGLSKIGRPLNNLVFTVHKLISIAAIVLTAIAFFQLQKATTLTPVELYLSIASVILIIASVGSGGLLSFDKFATPPFLLLHKIIPALTVISCFITFYLLNRGR